MQRSLRTDNGGAGTLHANAPADVPARLEALALTGGLGRLALHAQVSAALHLVLHLRRVAGRRVLDEVCLLVSEAGLVRAERVWQRHTGAGPAAGRLAELLAARGVARPAALVAP